MSVIVYIKTSYNIRLTTNKTGKAAVRLYKYPLKNCNNNNMNCTDDAVFCGYAPFVEDKNCHAFTNNNTLWQCSNKAHVVVLWIVSFIFAIVIIISNFLLPLIVWKNKERRNHHNYIKGIAWKQCIFKFSYFLLIVLVSFSLNDMIMGFILLFSFLPNLTNELSNTRTETCLDQTRSIDTASTTTGTFVYLLTLQVS